MPHNVTQPQLIHSPFYHKSRTCGIKTFFAKPKKFVRYYPSKSNAPSKFSENTTERDLREYHTNLDQKVEDIKNRLEDMEDKITLELEYCGSKEEAEKARESLSKEVKAESAKYLEEIKDDSELYKESLKDSSFTAESKEIEKKNIEKQVEGILIEEGESLMKLLNKIEESYVDACEFYDQAHADSSSEKSSTENFESNKDLSPSENKKSETKGVQSPIDFVLEKEQCNMPDIPDSDGGE